MARKVYLNSNIAEDERMIEAAAENGMAPCLYPFLLPFFDDWGRAEASAVKVKARAVPLFDIFTVSLIKECLEIFFRLGLIQRYDVAGKQYMAIEPATWFKYQTHVRGVKRINDSQSKYPCPESHRSWWEQQRVSGIPAHEDEGEDVEASEDTQGNRNQGDTARNRTQPRADARNRIPSSLPPVHPSPSLAVIPTLADNTDLSDSDGASPAANQDESETMPPVGEESKVDDFKLIPEEAKPTKRRRDYSKWEWLRGEMSLAWADAADWYESVLYREHPRHEQPQDGWKALKTLISANVEALRTAQGRAMVIEKHQVFKDSEQWQEARYVPLIASWLRDRAWEGEPVPASSPRASPAHSGRGMPKPPPPSMDELRRGNQESLERIVRGEAMVL